MGGGYRRNAQVNLPIPDGDLNATVLGESLFGNRHSPRHDFQTRNDRRLQPLRRTLHFLQNSIHTKPNAKHLLHRLQMNVTGPHGVSFHQQRRDHPNDRSVARIRFTGLFLIHIRTRRLGGIRPDPVPLKERLTYGARCATNKFRRHPQQMRQTVECVKIQRVGDRNHQTALSSCDRHHLKALSKLFGQLIQNVRFDVQSKDIDKFHGGVRR